MEDCLSKQLYSVMVKFVRIAGSFGPLGSLEEAVLQRQLLSPQHSLDSRRHFSAMTESSHLGRTFPCHLTLCAWEAIFTGARASALPQWSRRRPVIYANTVLLFMKCGALIDADVHMSSWGHMNGLFLSPLESVRRQSTAML